MSIPLYVLQWPATMEEPPSEEVSSVEEGETWMTPLIRYLEANILPEDRREARKIKKQAARYCNLPGEVVPEVFLWSVPKVCHTPRSL